MTPADGSVNAAARTARLQEYSVEKMHATGVPLGRAAAVSGECGKLRGNSRAPPRLNPKN
jgi:hypothetical protein